MNLWMAVGLSILAIYRLSYLIAKEDGPFDMFASLRGKIGQEGWFGRGLNCPNCLSFWISIVPAIYISSSFLEFFTIWLGMAGMALIINELFYDR